MVQPQFHSICFFPMEYNLSVKEASTKVIVAKTVIIINHLAAMAKSGSTVELQAPFCNRAVVKMRETVFAFAKIQSHFRSLLQLHQSNVRQRLQLR